MAYGVVEEGREGRQRQWVCPDKSPRPAFDCTHPTGHRSPLHTEHHHNDCRGRRTPNNERSPSLRESWYTTRPAGYSHT